MQFPRSNRKRIIKKWYRRTGSYKITRRNYAGMVDGMYWYEMPSWFPA